MVRYIFWYWWRWRWTFNFFMWLGRWHLLSHFCVLFFFNITYKWIACHASRLRGVYVPVSNSSLPGKPTILLLIKRASFCVARLRLISRDLHCCIGSHVPIVTTVSQEPNLQIYLETCVTMVAMFHRSHCDKSRVFTLTLLWLRCWSHTRREAAERRSGGAAYNSPITDKVIKNR